MVRLVLEFHHLPADLPEPLLGVVVLRGRIGDEAHDLVVALLDPIPHVVRRSNQPMLALTQLSNYI